MEEQIVNITIDRESTTPIYLQIKHQIQEQILSGKLAADFPLPPERKLAESLGVNRTTVFNAYQELKADGLIASHVGRGTIVISTNDGAGNSGSHPSPLLWRQLFSESASRARDSLLGNILQMVSRHDIISFAAGVPAQELEPVDVIRDLQTQVLKDGGQAAFLHTPVEGHHPLRESIVKLLESREINVSLDELIVLSGSQQGLDIASRIFLESGDVVIVEEPTFFCALQTFRAAGARIVGVPIDENGMRMDALKPLIEKYRPKLIYTIPNFQNPSGVVMNLERRLEMLDLAYHYQIPILEDDPYGLLRYEGKAVPPLKALDRLGYVMYLSTFSKILCPGFRVGWMAAPKPVIRQFAWVKQNMDLHTSSLSQCLLDRFCRENYFSNHLKTLNQRYLQRRNIMLRALERYAMPDIFWNTPQGGYYIWCCLSEDVNTTQLLTKATEHRVAYVPGEAFYNDGQGQNYLRLNFSYPAVDQIDIGIKKLMQVIQESVVTTIDEEFPLEVRPII
ncbi:MAG TPA: PLP-dependent aminotransferase family protein [Firmicutes bacterium]|nr:PLP-dependent aminotransferase family protein [Bacillota bacterium]